MWCKVSSHNYIKWLDITIIDNGVMEGWLVYVIRGGNGNLSTTPISPAAWFLEVKERVCYLEKPSLPVGKMITPYNDAHWKTPFNVWPLCMRSVASRIFRQWNLKRPKVMQDLNKVKIDGFKMHSFECKCLFRVVYTICLSFYNEKNMKNSLILSLRGSTLDVRIWRLTSIPALKR